MPMPKCAYANDMWSLNKSNDELKSILHLVSQTFARVNLSIFGFAKIPFRIKIGFMYVLQNCWCIIFGRVEFQLIKYSTFPCSDYGPNFSLPRMISLIFSKLLFWLYRCRRWHQEDVCVVKCCHTFLIKTNCFIRSIVIMFTDEL